jgi:glycosyltransferase involved in cell wall biosynthesis
MFQVVEDRRLATRLITRGFERVGQFSWDRCARETLALLEDVAA